MSRRKPTVSLTLAAISVVTLPTIGAYFASRLTENTRGVSTTHYLDSAHAALVANDASLAIYYAGAATAESQSTFTLTSAADIAISAGNLTLAKTLLTRAIAVAGPDDQAMLHLVQERLSLPVY